MTVAKIILFSLTISVFLSETQTLNILGIFPYQGKSHFFVFKPYLEELAKRGHNVTVISYFPRKEPLNNYHDVSLAGKVEVLESVIPLEQNYLVLSVIIWFLVEFGVENCKVMLADEQVQNLWKSDVQFDVTVVEQFNSDCALGLAYKFGAPVVGVTSHVFMSYHYKRFGIPYHPAYVPSQLLSGGTKPTLYQRIERLIVDWYLNIAYKYYGQAVSQNELAKYFDDVPPLEDLAREIKFVLLYHNFILTGSRLFPANIKEVGGYHVAKPKPLPEDLKKFIDESEHGIIYVSFGSMVKASTTPIHTLEAILGALAQLPQKVVFKWDTDTLPGNPKNFYVSSWLPQNDILAHPKVMAFYSHAGMLGTTEAIYHGVPMVAMPIFGDQPSNAAAVAESGLGVQILVGELTAEKLLEKFKIVLNPEFRNRVKQISKAWHDRPISPMDSAIYWTEYAAHHPNFIFRTAAADVPLYQHMYLDILLVFLAVILAPFITYATIKSIFSSQSTENKNSDKKKSKRE